MNYIKTGPDQKHNGLPRVCATLRVALKEANARLTELKQAAAKEAHNGDSTATNSSDSKPDTV